MHIYITHTRSNTGISRITVQSQPSKPRIYCEANLKYILIYISKYDMITYYLLYEYNRYIKNTIKIKELTFQWGI